jgi:uncharacterized protein involved in exopolysaccharide biosynthesis
MTARHKIDALPFVSPRAHYDNIFEDGLRTLWQRKWLILTLLIVGLAIQSAVLVYTETRYTGEATIQVTFVREDATGATVTKSQSIASLDATSIVESAARLIRSRATASAVVTRLGLDKDPTFTRLPMLVRLMSEARSALHHEQIPISEHDLAVRSLQSRLNVTNEPRSYLITIAASAGRAEQAAQLANTVASEYLRNEALQRGADLVATAEREFAELSSTYGVRHPKYLEGGARIERLKSELARVRDLAKTEEIASLVVGQSFIPARPVLTPSSPNVMINLALAAAGALVMGGWLALLLERRRRARSVQTEVVSDGEDGVAAGGDNVDQFIRKAVGER